MKIVFLDGYTLNPGDLDYSVLSEFGETEIYERTSPEETDARLRGAQVVLPCGAPLSSQNILSCPTIKFIGVLATGYEQIALQTASERGIPVCNIPTYGTEAVAQLAIAQLLAIANGVERRNQIVRKGNWGWKTDPEYLKKTGRLIELAGKTMGIIGFGQIGRQVAAIATALHMNVIYCNRHDRDFPDLPLCRRVSFDELLAASDVISLHLSSMDAKTPLIGRETIARMKNGVIFLNTARGSLVDETALREALDSGKIYYAATDVASREPIAADNPLLCAENCLITPHIGWAATETRKRLLFTAVQNLRAYMEGRLQNCVNLPND